ncbi:MAG: Hsp20 family protein [Alcanivorax sp.]|nr:Hsp20 family protein [Alcanivorax sp.]
MNAEFSLAPLFRHSVGFDRFNELFDSALRADQSGSFPPYDIVREGKGPEGEDRYRIVMAVAGYRRDDIEIVARENKLTVQGSQQASKQDAGEPDQQQTWLHRGIARRDFERHFRLADHVYVESADLQDGLLEIRLKREIPEERRPRVIAINGSAH